MHQSLLEQLRSMTTIVADSGDVESILKFKPQDSTTNPALIAAAAEMPRYRPLVDDTLRSAKAHLGARASDTDVAKLAFRRLGVAFGKKILKEIPGRVSTEVDARLSYDREATIAQARDIIQQYFEAGVPRSRVLVKIAATWEGIQAAKLLEQEDIHCNLTLIFGIHQAAACVEAQVTLISPFVGRILDWYKSTSGKNYLGADDPGVQSVTEIYNYVKKFGARTLVMGASFRNVSEICHLAGCDLLTISPKLLAELDTTSGELARALSAEAARESSITRIGIDQDTFEQLHRRNRMATDQLTDGIDKFGTALGGLETLLAGRLAELGENSSRRAAGA